MKIKDGFILRQVAGQNVVLPMGEDLNLNNVKASQRKYPLYYRLLENKSK